MTDKEFCKIDTAFYGEEVRSKLKEVRIVDFNEEVICIVVKICCYFLLKTIQRFTMEH